MNQVPADAFGAFDFGLTEQQEERAAILHREAIICDMLFQGPCGYRSFSPEMDAELEADFERHRSDLQYVYAAIAMPVRRAVAGEFPEFEACWVTSGITAGNRQVAAGFSERLGAGWALNTQQFDLLPWLVKALRANDIRSAKAEGKRAGFISSQDTVDMGQNLDMLDALHGMGLRMLQLTYNSLNFVGAGCTERTDSGVSNFGVAVIGRMNDLGIIVDTGHCGRQTTLDACALSNQPVVASHTAASGVYAVDRAKSDEELCALAGTGGVIGICAVPFFLAPGTGVTIDAMLDHIEYVANLVGWQHVGIGTDWPLQGSKAAVCRLDAGGAEIGFRPEHNLDSATNLIGFDDYRDFPNITRGLVHRGYNDEQIRGILGENFLRVFAQVGG
jgi:membrane dipeptidase